MTSAVSVFIVHHPRDAAHRHALEIRLAPMIQKQVISVVPGPAAGDHVDEISARLETSDVVLVLLSPDLMASDGLVGTLLRASEHARREQTVVSLLIRPCSLWGSPLQDREILAFNQRALTSAAHVDEAWHHVQNRLFELLLAVRHRDQSESTERPPPSSIPPTLPAPRAKKSLLYRMISAPQEAIGASFRGYHLLEFLGQGGTGVCYRVRHGSLGREACLKLTYPLIGVPQAIMAAVSRTVRALGAVDHPAIIKLRDFGVMDIEEDTTFYVCMDLVSNQTLASWAREKQPSFAEIMHVLAVVADALHAAHSCRFFDETGCEQVGILHGDIKPDNILMTRSGEPVITDFMMPDLHRMIAEDVNKLEFFRRNDDFSSRECVTSSFGTPHYMSPEQGVYGLLTVRSDVYSLGVTTFEAMLRYVPALAALFEPINDLISLMTSERPEDRPSSMEQVALRFRELARAAAR